MKDYSVLQPFLMLKKILLVTILAVNVMTASAQKLKITDVTVTDQKLWDEQTKSLFGKSITLTMFDNAVKVELPGDKPLVLRQSSSKPNQYVQSTDSRTETQTYTLTVQSTLRVVTSATLTLLFSESKSPYRTASMTLTAKRF